MLLEKKQNHAIALKVFKSRILWEVVLALV